jgi:hypothetical protein
MPTVQRLDRYRFYLYSREPNEPPHIHVEWGNRLAKFWLEPVKSSRRFRDHELRAVRLLVLEHRETFLDAWHEHFDPEH